MVIICPFKAPFAVGLKSIHPFLIIVEQLELIVFQYKPDALVKPLKYIDPSSSGVVLGGFIIDGACVIGGHLFAHGDIFAYSNNSEAKSRVRAVSYTQEGENGK